jgi:hypothetical protein
MSSKLADETLLTIFRYVDASDRSRVQDLRNLCLSCKRFRALALPFLYATFETTFETLDSNGQECQLFLRAIIEHSQLAALVRCVVVPFWYTKDDGDNGLGRKGIETAQIIVKAARNLRRLAQEDQDEWLEDLESGSTDAHIALLLCLTKNVEVLDVVVPYHRETGKLHVLDVVVEAALKPNALPHQFHRFRTIKAQHYDTEGGFDAGFYAPFFQLPSLRSIQGLATFSNVEAADHQWPIATSNVESITLRNSDITEEMISSIVGACKALKECQLEWGYFTDYTEMDSEFTIEGIWQALRSQNHSLEVLELDCSDPSWVRETGEPFQSISTLKDFDKLAKLSVSAMFLTGSHDKDDSATTPILKDMLPSSLHSLRILDGGSAIFDALSVLAETCTQDLPALRILDISRLHVALSGNRAEDKIKLFTAFSLANVELLVEMDLEAEHLRYQSAQRVLV